MEEYADLYTKILMEDINFLEANQDLERENNLISYQENKTFHTMLSMPLETLMAHAIASHNQAAIKSILNILDIPKHNSDLVPLSTKERLSLFYINKGL